MSAKITKKHETPNVLRKVPDEKAFFFYKAVGMPLGIKANSLEEFSKKLKEVDLASVKFHSERHDFENWVKMLGDEVLAEQLYNSSKKSRTSESLRTELSQRVESRLNSFRR